MFHNTNAAPLETGYQQPRLGRLGDVGPSSDKDQARDADDALAGPATRTPWQRSGGFGRDVDPDHGEITCVQFQNFRAVVPTRTGGMGVSSGAKASLKHKRKRI